MKFLLTSGGIRNDSIHRALLDLLGKPVEECNAIFIPTAMYGHPMAGPTQAYTSITGNSMASIGWKSVALIELTALPSMNRDVWLPLVEAADAVLVEGGDAGYLHHWMRESGLATMLSNLAAVYVGMSAGSMVMTLRTGNDFINWPKPRANDDMLGFVDFAIFPHMDYPGWESNTMAAAEKWSENIGIPAYGIDDDSAIVVIEGEVRVVSEGLWKFFPGPGI